MKVLNVIKKLFSSDKKGSCYDGGRRDAPVSGMDSQGDPIISSKEDGYGEDRDAIPRSWEDLVSGIQQGFFSFTFDKDSVGFRLDPENRWVLLAQDVFQPGLEELYTERLKSMRDTTRGEKLAEKLSRLVQDDEVAAYGEQLQLPHIDSAVLDATKDCTKTEGGFSNAGRKPYPFRLVLGILTAQKILGLSDEGICKMVSESPYLQWFLGYESFSVLNTVHPSNLTHFKKRLNLETMQKVNEIVLANQKHKDELLAAQQAHMEPGQAAKPEPQASTCRNTDGGSGKAGEGSNAVPAAEASGGEGIAGAPKNEGTLILDATCGPVNIRFPQDFSILNEARLDLECIIDRICKDYPFSKPRTYVRSLQSEFLKVAKSKKRNPDEVRHLEELELNAIKRNLGYINGFLADDTVELSDRELERIQVIRAVYAQQKYMFDRKVKRVSNRIVSISLPFVRPIARGKAAAPYEFGPKYDIDIDSYGMARITTFSYDNFNEGTHLINAIESYKERTGHYPERVLADQIYRNRGNQSFCKENGIRLSGPKLGRKPKDAELLAELFRTEHDDMVDRTEVERHFSREKRCFGISPIVERTFENIGYAVGMSVFLDNVVPVAF